MARTYAVGIDIGTYQVKVIVAQNSQRPDEKPIVLGVGHSESKGLRHGYIINTQDAIRSIRKAVDQAEKMSGVKIGRAMLSIGGIGLSSIVSVGTIYTSRADSEITELDMEKVKEECKNAIAQPDYLNKKIIHEINLAYKIDGKVVLGNPVGMKGSRLEAKTLFIACLEHHYNDLILAVEEAGIEVIGVMASPLAASVISLTKAQKIAGCVMANLGSDTVSIVVFENNLPISLQVFPIGSNDITNDIALGLRIPLEEAEQIKLGSVVGAPYPRKKLDEIIRARLSDIFELIEAHLKKIGKNGLLPAGIIITGGGSSIATIEDLAKEYLKLPSRIGHMSAKGDKIEIKDSTWSVAYGLCVIALSEDGDMPTIRGVKEGFRKGRNWLKRFFQQLVP